MMSAGELESGNAGEPAKLIRQRYREAADIIRKGKMCCLFINDLDAGAGRLGGTTQYTVNNQMVNATLMNIADNPTNVQLPGMYNKEENPRVPIIVTGNDFSTLYAPLIRDGRMEKFYWSPTREDRIGVCKGIFRHDSVPDEDVVKIVDTFPGQSIGKFMLLYLSYVVFTKKSYQLQHQIITLLPLIMLFENFINNKSNKLRE
jgi:ATP-dependent 26S proteasome regulatory subunit